MKSFTFAVTCSANVRFFHWLAQSYRRIDALRHFVEYRSGCGAKINAQLERQNIEIAMSVGKLSCDIWQC